MKDFKITIEESGVHAATVFDCSLETYKDGKKILDVTLGVGTMASTALYGPILKLDVSDHLTGPL